MARKWSQEEINYVITHYPTEDTNLILERFGRSRSSLEKLVAKYGLKKNNNNLYDLSNEDINYIQENYQTLSQLDLSKRFGLSQNQMRYLFSTLGLKKHQAWSENEDDFLRKNWLTKSDYEVAECLSRTYSSVLKRRNKLGLKRYRETRIIYNISERNWTKEDESFLKGYYKVYPIGKLAESLNRSESAIRNKVNRLGLTDPRFSTQPEKEAEIILEELQQIYVSQLPIGIYIIDQYIPNKNIAIEVHGDFWHCNPKVYPNGPVSVIQERNIANDKKKKSYLQSVGISVIYVWEYDIVNNRDKVKEFLYSSLNK